MYNRRLCFISMRRRENTSKNKNGRHISEQSKAKVPRKRPQTARTKNPANSARRRVPRAEPWIPGSQSRRRRRPESCLQYRAEETRAGRTRSAGMIAVPAERSPAGRGEALLGPRTDKSAADPSRPANGGGRKGEVGGGNGGAVVVSPGFTKPARFRFGPVPNRSKFKIQI